MTGTVDPSIAHRLPRTAVPSRYELVLEVDPAADRFGGSVEISVDVTGATESIELHALDLDVSSASLVRGSEDLALDVRTVPDDERLVLGAPRTVEPGPAVLRITFAGALGDQLVGLYRSWMDLDGERVPLAVTQFESTHARRAFPCFDEPDLKAVFSITAVVPADQLVVSNAAEVDREELGDGRARVSFADTMPMSTYLVALVVGRLEATPPVPVAGTAAGVPLRVVHPPGGAHLCGFALEIAAAALEFFERWYGLPYPGDKLDLVAVPDFAFGAMENLGCVTFREVLLLVDPERATRAELHRVADVIDHELAHMWFGDLVTMQWWEGIWLNEAFATFMEVTATDAFRPEWDAWGAFGLARAAAFDTDALASTRPVEYPVGSPSEAEGMFDVLTYEKGASIVRMLERYLGPDAFRSGISAYLQAHAHGNTVTTDLWDALEAATGEPVRRIMDPWVRDPGHPCVEVVPASNGVTLRQAPMRLDTAAAAPAQHAGGRPRPVPLVVTTAVNGVRAPARRVLLEDHQSVELPAGAALQVNTGADAFVRTLLPAALRSALALDPSTPAVERFMLLDDTWALLLAGRVPAAEAVALLRQLAWRESDPSVWKRIAAAVRELRRLAGPGHDAALASLCRELTDPVGGAAERAIAALDPAAAGSWREVRSIVTSLRGTVGSDPAIVAAAPGWLDDPGTDPDLRAAALDVVAASADPSVHADLVGRWRSAATPQEELRLLSALADTDDAEAFASCLELALTEVRSQDAPFLLRRALTNRSHAGAAWATVSRHWDELLALFATSAPPRMLEGVRSFTDGTLAGSARAFLADHPLPSGGTSVSQHLERMDVTVAAAGRVRDELAASPDALS